MLHALLLLLHVLLLLLLLCINNLDARYGIYVEAPFSDLALCMTATRPNLYLVHDNTRYLRLSVESVRTSHWISFCFNDEHLSLVSTELPPILMATVFTVDFSFKMINMHPKEKKNNHNI